MFTKIMNTVKGHYSINLILVPCKMDIKDGTTKLTFKYELSGTTAAAYSIYALSNGPAKKQAEKQ